MTAEPIFESLYFNAFLAKDYLSDSNQDSDVDIMIFLLLKLATYCHVKLTTNRIIFSQKRFQFFI